MGSGTRDRTLIRQYGEVAETFRTWSGAYANLADARLGACVVAASDEWYAPAARLLDAAPANYYFHDDEGMRWVDGWETVRRRQPGNEWCVIRLGRPGTIAGIGLDTSFFTGNFPPVVSVQACRCESDAVPEGVAWTPILRATEVKGDAQVVHPVDDAGIYTHVRLNLHPDGGMARLRVFGRIAVSAQTLPDRGDLAALELGGRVLACSDAHFGSVSAMLAPGPQVQWGKGWESRRRRVPGHDWAVIALATPGVLEEVVLDTKFYTGNHPASFSLQAADLRQHAPGGAADDALIVNQAMYWSELLAQQPLRGGAENRYRIDGDGERICTHVRLNIYPDGGVTRLRLIGRPVRGSD
ncbi:allantoicase [Verticiella sediminum]|uniref:Probable allantoicase n=1 Tax=Verticiella sediminum TaxID=1247510 RepID=A0A556ARN2_9BURK|nr:allantoicase [Verticiella sediminum]TSH95075.1 allantoicase [Verticiella sediminum]